MSQSDSLTPALAAAADAGDRAFDAITSDSYRITLQIVPEGTGWRVNVSVDDRVAATTIENTDYEAAVIGVGLAHRALAAWRRQR